MSNKSVSSEEDKPKGAKNRKIGSRSMSRDDSIEKISRRSDGRRTTTVRE